MFSSKKRTATAIVLAASLMVLSPAFVQSFQVIRSSSHRSLLQNTLPLRALSSPEQSDDPAIFASPVDTIGSTNDAPLSDAKDTAIEARTMDEGIYGFNKKLIDTVYDIICFLYPVKGTERDFARFYVLETVARVPYFAYLSVMHLRETFGERYDSMSERCVSEKDVIALRKCDW